MRVTPEVPGATDTTDTTDAYRQAGVDIDAGVRAVALMRSAVRATHGPQVLADLGYFGGLYALDPVAPDGPVLVAGADGVGTKLKLAFALGTHRSVGHDLVNHCVNDILTCGARPLFFLDYFASGKLEPEQAAEAVTGMAEACRTAGCALLGGETAEMPGMYSEGEYDVAGFIVGVVARDRMLLGLGITPGDVALALPSNGLHTNGYSLARKIFALEGDPRHVREQLYKYEDALGETLGEALTRPHASYLAEVTALLELLERPVKGMAHITGGGLLENIPRTLPSSCAVELYTGEWQAPPIFALIQERGNVSPQEMARVFNMGIGMVIIVAPEDVALVQSRVPQLVRIGLVTEREGSEAVILHAGRRVVRAT